MIESIDASGITYRSNIFPENKYKILGTDGIVLRVKSPTGFVHTLTVPDTISLLEALGLQMKDIPGYKPRFKFEVVE